MKANKIYQAKEAHRDMTVTDAPITISADFEIDAKTLARAAASKNGVVLSLSDIILDADAIEKRVVDVLSSNYFPKDDDYKLNFLLVSSEIKDLNSTMKSGYVGFSTAFSAMYGCSLPTDVISTCGKYRKMLDMDKPMSFLKGKEHSAVHCFGVPCRNSYELLCRSSRLNPKMVFPDNTCHGSGGSMPQDFHEVKKSHLHGHAVDNDTMYAGGPLSTLSETVKLQKERSLSEYQTDLIVGLPKESYPHSWYANDDSLTHEKGVMIELDRYVSNMFDFMDTLNQSRSTNFRKCGMWIDAKLDSADVQPVFGQIEMRIIPIVPLIPSGKEHIPFCELRRHVKNSLVATKNPFDSI